MIEQLVLTPGYSQNILISVNALVDIDIGLYNLVKEQYLDPTVFDEDYLTKANTLDFIMSTYFRKYDNPLYNIAIINDKKILDDYYMEFMKTQYNDIYDRSIYTDVLSLINNLYDNNDIKITILYYTEYAKEQLIKDQEKGILNSKVEFINIKDFKKEVDKYNDIYFRSIFELNNIDKKLFTSPKRFYISTFSRNYDSSGRMIKIPILEEIMTDKLLHEISEFSLYNTSIINKNRKIKGDK